MSGVGSGFRLALYRLRGQAALLALLLVLALLLPVGAGALLASALSPEGGFAGLTVALADEGAGEDGATRRLTAALISFSGTEGYCQWVAMEPDEARAALEAGEVTAVLLLPEGFLDSVLSGENLPVTLLTSRARPLESWLVQWLGQSVSRMLAAAQAGIYTVSERYHAAGVTKPGEEEMLLQVNLAYLGWVSGREELYDSVTVSATGTLSVTHHYALSVLAYLPLLAAPLLYPAFGGDELAAWHRRRRAVGLSPASGALGAVAASAALLLPLVWLPLAALGGGLDGLLPAALTAWTAVAYCGLCAVLARSAGAAGLMAFLPATLALVLAGGVLPPALLPRGLREMVSLCPLTWARETLAAALDYPVPWPRTLALAALAALLTAVTALCFRMRVDRGEGAAA